VNCDVYAVGSQLFCWRSGLLTIQVRLAAMSFSVQRRSIASKPNWARGSGSLSILPLHLKPQLDKPAIHENNLSVELSNRLSPAAELR